MHKIGKGCYWIGADAGGCGWMQLLDTGLGVIDTSFGWVTVGLG